MADAIGAQSVKFKVTGCGFQPAAHAPDCLLISSDVDYDVNVLGYPRRLDVAFTCIEPYHLATDKAPASRKVLV